jgi:hypothetical protein
VGQGEPGLPPAWWETAECVTSSRGEGIYIWSWSRYFQLRQMRVYVLRGLPYVEKALVDERIFDALLSYRLVWGARTGHFSIIWMPCSKVHARNSRHERLLSTAAEGLPDMLQSLHHTSLIAVWLQAWNCCRHRRASRFLPPEGESVFVVPG